MKNPKPYFSIITATYNRAEYISTTLDSVLNQTFTNWEIIIVDDGSTDNTGEVLKEYLYDARINYYLRPETYQKGLPGSRNYGIDISNGECILFIDDDDIVHPQLLELCNEELSRRDIDFCRYLRTTFTGNFDEEFNLEKDYAVSKFNIDKLEFMITNVIPFNSCQIAWKKSSFNGERFNESLMYAEEWEFYTRILTSGLKGVTIEKVLFFGRKHSASNTGEYQRDIPVRKNSYIKAHLLIIENLAKRRLLSANLIKYFIRKGFLLKSNSILNHILFYSGFSRSKRRLYKLGFKIYPLLKPIFYIKSKI
ncbi:MAG: glycosyltransferase family 2 protein [Christiangramia sp.]|uniref:glycosyltransferase family 2 protein n=1 Tax=Christiangramia sp. TaxID=1931228 RepID=UPI0032427ADE